MLARKESKDALNLLAISFPCLLARQALLYMHCCKQSGQHNDPRNRCFMHAYLLYCTEADFERHCFSGSAGVQTCAMRGSGPSNSSSSSKNPSSLSSSSSTSFSSFRPAFAAFLAAFSLSRSLFSAADMPSQQGSFYRLCLAQEEEKKEKKKIRPL